MASETDIEQSSKIAALEKDIEILRDEVARYKDKEHEDLTSRLRSLEKQVWGAGAVIAVLFAGVGIITQMEDDDDWDESRIEQVIYRA
tara:strand:+ start:245 stop:508 length:264 start_codon:yes stop_codon:yes gene_type:complete